jgi:ribonucrease Y
VGVGSGALLVLLGLLAVAGAVLWMSRRGESRALVAAREEVERSIDRASRQLEQIEADRSEVARLREDLERRESRLAEQTDRLDAKLTALDDRVEQLAARESELERQRADLLDIEAERTALLESVAGLSVADAKAELVAAIENDAKREAVRTVREIERTANDEGEALAKRILTTTIQRLASGQTAESVVTVVPLPGSDMKGRIIGREGRNVRTFEQVTGVNVIIDDTPDAVLLSCFDPVRRETARVALEQLVIDGRIHPSRIEEVFEHSKSEVERLCVRAGEDAAVEFAITDLHPELVRTLGQLRYRTSYGQNVLEHVRESAQLAGLMADEIGLDRTSCVRAALLHDLGKALTHEAEGSHALVGADLGRRYGEADDVVHAIEAHHNEVEPRTVEAVLVQAADAISGSRPGARRESLESYVKRLKRLEEIAGSKPGVDKVFAMQAGREVRVMVLPEEVDDIQAQVLARDIVKEYEEELTYPGQIKVVVVRESRSTEVAR